MWSTLHLLKHQRSYFPVCILNWPNEKFFKSDESGWSSFPVHLQQVSCIKPSKAQRRHFRLTSNQQAIKGWRLWWQLVWNKESCLECISRCGTQLSWKRKSTKLYWTFGTHDTFQKNMGCNMSLKIHFLHRYFFFSSNCGDISDKHRVRFHQVIAVMEKRYQGRCSPSILADYCWTFAGDQPDLSYSKKGKRKRLWTCKFLLLH